MAENNSFQLIALEDSLVDNLQETTNGKRDKRKEAKLSRSKQRKKILESISQLNSELKHSKITQNVENETKSHKSISPRSSLQSTNLKTLDFKKIGRKVKLVSCLGYLKNGSTAYSGVDITSGQLFYVTEWHLRKSQIKQKCIVNGRCLWTDKETTDCNGTEHIDRFIATIEEQVTNLSQLNHINLVHYDCVLCIKHKRILTVFLVEDFICGESISAMSAGGLVDWSIGGTRRVAKAVLNALVYLHEKGCLYGQLLSSAILFDNARIIHCKNYSIVPFLKDFMDSTGCSTTEMSIKADLIDLGKLVKSLTNADDVKDFIESCNTVSFSSQLLQHPFVNFPNESILEGTSRFHTEYEILMYLGRGAFGDVHKVRSIGDNLIYAIKRVLLISASPQYFKKISREVELLSCLKHENVVRYYCSWAEKAQTKNIKQSNAAFSQIWSLRNESSEDSSLDMSSTSNTYNDNFKKAKTDDDENNDIPASETLTEISYIHILHIQMEFCDKRTLRNAIEENLCENTARVWHLFYGIDQGISHIHQHGIIHRDLKPENIFLDCKGNIKIGDFGMATTEFSMGQQQSIGSEKSNMTGKVGTSLYVAPELIGNAFESFYNHKVDMYAFGIILFEMIQPAFTTVMERIKVLSALRSPDVVIPVTLLSHCKYQAFIKLISLLLKHDPSERPDTNHAEFLLLRNDALLEIISSNRKNNQNKRI